MANTRLRSSVICIYQEKILGFHAVDPTSKKKYFFIPGGAPEEQESMAECAQRETLEETGYKVDIDQRSELIKSYDFFWNGQLYQCTTHFFRAKLAEQFTPPKGIKDASYHKGADWLPVANIKEIFSYDENILEAVSHFLKT